MRKAGDTHTNIHKQAFFKKMVVNGSKTKIHSLHKGINPLQKKPP